MTKFEIKEYLKKLYGLPVSAVHTAIYLGKQLPRSQGGGVSRKRKKPDYKKAFVYLKDQHGEQLPRYEPIERQMTPEARAAWPQKPERFIPIGKPMMDGVRRDVTRREAAEYAKK